MCDVRCAPLRQSRYLHESRVLGVRVRPRQVANGAHVLTGSSVPRIGFRVQQIRHGHTATDHPDHGNAHQHCTVVHPRLQRVQYGDVPVKGRG